MFPDRLVIGPESTALWVHGFASCGSAKIRHPFLDGWFATSCFPRYGRSRLSKLATMVGIFFLLSFGVVCAYICVSELFLLYANVSEKFNLLYNIQQ